MKKVDSFFNEFAESLQKARNSSNRFAYKCNCPNCETKAIKSHLIQRHPTLESIADVENKVLQFEDNWEDARSERWNLYTSRIRGINDAMQYPLFVVLMILHYSRNLSHIIVSLFLNAIVCY